MNWEAVGTWRITVSGRVQGVGYRAATQLEASRLGLTGYVRNLPNGDVEIVASGQTKLLETLVSWSRRGPVFARVDSVRVAQVVASETRSAFEIR